ncbi:MAG: hypothetical protein R2792_02095 [Saprospiraceae bacterium]
MNIFKQLPLLLFLAVLGISISNCKKSKNDPMDNSGFVCVVGDTCFSLLAGQNTDVGSVCMSVNDDELCITYSTSGDWTLDEAQVWIGAVFADLPTDTAGNPIISQFPFQASSLGGATDHQFCIPLQDLGIIDDGTCSFTLFIAAHAIVVNGANFDSAWAEGTQIGDPSNWATFSTISLNCDPDHASCGDCETAFAFGDSLATCFIDGDFDQDGQPDGINRWGWTNYLETPGLYNFELWAGAGQCDLNKGTLVGTVSVDYDGALASVTIDIDSSYMLNESHLYLGTDPLPTKNNKFTVAPGQYPYKHGDLGGVSSDAFMVDGLSGPIYLVFHAVVCGF